MTDKARELLEWVVKETELMPDNFHISDMLDEKIRAYLAESTQDEEPTLLTKEELGAIMLDWMNTPKSRDSDLYRAVQEEVLRKNGCPVPRPEFVRLTDEEIVSWWGVATEAGLIEFARSIEDALEEKNRG